MNDMTSREKRLASLAGKWKKTSQGETDRRCGAENLLLQQVRKGHLSKDDLLQNMGESPIYVKMESKKLGIFSVIKEYVNKDGKAHMAHFTINNKYLGTVTKLGENPTSYNGYFDIRERMDEFDFIVPDKDNITIEECFVMKEQKPEEKPEEEEEKPEEEEEEKPSIPKASPIPTPKKRKPKVAQQ